MILEQWVQILEQQTNRFILICQLWFGNVNYQTTISLKKKNCCILDFRQFNQKKSFLFC